jgi:hypothetical protein
MTDTANDTTASRSEDGTRPTGELAARVARLESRVADLSRAGDPSDGSPGSENGSDRGGGADDRSRTTRRGALAAGGLLAALGLGVAPARADPQGQVGTADDPVERLYAAGLFSPQNPTAVVWTDGSTVHAAAADGMLASSSTADGPLQAAVDRCATADGGAVVIRDGEYVVTSEVTLASNSLTIVGESMDNTLLKGGQLPPDAAVFAGVDGLDYVQLRNFAVSTFGSGADGVRLSNGSSEPSHHALEFLHVYDCGTGLRLENCEDSTVRACRIAANDVGIRYTTPGGRASVENVHVLEHTRAGIEFEAKQLTVDGGIFGTDTDAPHLTQAGPRAELVELTGCWFEQTPHAVDGNGYTTNAVNLVGGYVITDDGHAAVSGDVGTFNTLGTSYFHKGDGAEVSVIDHTADHGIAVGHRLYPGVSFGNGPRDGFRFGRGDTRYLTHERALRAKPRDLTLGGLAPADEGVLANHDGGGSRPAGLYRSDPGNDRWVKVEDNSVTIPY